MVSQVQKFKRLYLSFSTLVFSLKCSSWSAISHQVSWIFLLVDFLGEHYTEECHKQWLALGLTSELVSQVQN